jgi:diaminopimelate decarboxylase
MPKIGTPYRDAARREGPLPGVWDYLRYDEAGDLLWNGLSVPALARRYGTPLEIVDTTLVERRGGEFRALAQAAATAAGYTGRLTFLYAAKANMASEMTAAAYRSGWQAETSAVQDLHNLRWLKRHELLPAGMRVVCNGFKLPPERLGWPLGDGVVPGAALPPPPDRSPRVGRSYAEEIRAMAADGWPITPMLDAGELDFFRQAGTPPMDVGLRLKFGHVDSLAEMEACVSRFGQGLDELRESARAVGASEHLTFTTLHAMVGAAETIPIGRLVDGIHLAARIWCELKADFPTLTELNMGGGLPPLGEPYDHRRFLDELFAMLMATAAAAGTPPPDFTFELGSLVAAEAGGHVFRVLQMKRNHRDAEDGPNWWAILDGGLMAAIPDMLFLGKPFRFLAATGADRPARHARLGDITCDSDGRYPPKSFGPRAHVLLPDWEDAPDAGEQFVLIAGVGAYQEILAGVRGAHHCGLLEALELILERGPDGRPQGRFMSRQSYREAAAVLGYRPEAVDGLRAAWQAAG